MKKFMRYYLTLITVLTMLNNVVLAADSVTQIKGKLPVILNGISLIGYAVAFGMFIYIGIKYMLSAANEKAALKQGAINFIIGGILIASASVVANIVASVAAGGSVGAADSLASELINTATGAAGFSGASST